MTIAWLLILFGVFARLNPEHVHNLVPIGAIALYAGARLPRLWMALAVPMAIMVVSDLAIDLYFLPQFRRGILAPDRLAVHGSYLAIAGLGWATCRRWRFATPVAMALVGSVLFFVVTNVAVWASGMSLRPMTMSGLIGCYVDAIPFYRNTLAADVGGAVALFGLDAVLRPVVEGRRAPVASAELG